MDGSVSTITKNNTLSIISFYERLVYFSDKTAFRNQVTEWSYAELAEMIRKYIGTFSLFTKKYIFLNIDNPVLFCAAFFSVIICGKVVVFGDIEKFGDDGVAVSEKDLNSITEQSEIIDLWKFAIDTEAPCVIMRSSGTTSVSKNVMLSQKNLMTEIITLTGLKLFTKDDIYLHFLPFSHLFGLMGDLLLPLFVGAVVCFGNKRSIFENMTFFNPTQMCLPPVALDSIIYLIDSSGCKKSVVGTSLHRIITGGANIKEHSAEILKLHGIDVIKAYGLTECSPCISIGFPDEQKHGSVGQILPCCDVKIISGEITVAGDTVMVGYWNDLDSTKKVIRDGRLYTGDLGSLDSDGYLYLSGRKTNLIVFDNSTKIVPEEVEKKILSIPEISECIVVDNSTGKHIKADIYIVSSETEHKSEIIPQVKKILYEYCHAEYVGEIHFSNIPLRRNELGKINRHFYRKC